MKDPSSDRQITGHPLNLFGDTANIANIFTAFIYLIFVTLFLAIIVVLFNGNYMSAWIIGGSIPLVLVDLYLIRRHHFEGAAAFLSIVFMSLVTITSTLGLGIHHIAILAFPVTLIVASLVTRRRTLFFLTVYGLICSAWLVFGELSGVYTPAVLVRSVPGDFFSVAIILILTSVMVRLLTESVFKSNLQLQKELRERIVAENKYRNIFDNAIDGIFQSTHDGHFLSVNPAMAHMYGYDSPEDMLESITDISSQVYVDSELRQSVRSRLANGEKITDYELQEYRKDGSTLWTSMNAQAIHDENGNILYFEGTVENITLRKEMELKRKAAENSLLQFRNLMDESNDAIFLIDPQTSGYIDFNKTACEKLGYSREELSRLGVIDIASHVTSLDVWLQRVALVEEKGDLLFESNYRRKNGTAFPTEVSARMLEYGGEKIMVANVRDITERKQTEVALQNNEKRLQAFFNQSLDGFFFSIFDTPQAWDESTDKEQALNQIFYNQRYTDANNAILEQYGLTREKFLGLTSSDVFAHDIEQGLQLRRQLFDSGHLRTETNERRQDGTPAWFEGEYACLYDEQKRILGYFGIQREITKRKHEELEREQLIQELAAKSAESETLRESFASLVGTFEFTQIVEHVLDQIGRVVPFDSASIWRLDGIVQKLIASRNLPPESDLEEMEIKVNEYNSALPIIHGEVPYVLCNDVQAELLDFKDPPHDIINSWLAIPLKTRGKIIGLIALDGHRRDQFNEHHAQLAVTFANQVAIALENARLFTELQNELMTRENLIRELESKNTELERFTYTVSHDLKSPLVTINGFLGYLKGDTASGNFDRVTTDIQRIQDAVDKMHLLLKELLELSRIGRIINPPENIPLEDLVRDALELVHGGLELRAVTVHTQPGLPAVQGDRQRLVEVLQNLLENAAKYMGDQSAPRIEIGQRTDLDQPVFFVKDNGIGIPAEYQERIFGLFNKLDPKTEGTGVGLALVRRIIEVHGGRIWVESEAGKGSTFCFTLAKNGIAS